MDIHEYELIEKKLTKRVVTPKVFCDLDGVLADFYAGMIAAFPTLKMPQDVVRFLEGDTKWGHVWDHYPNIFRTLPVIGDAKSLMMGLVRLRDKGYIRLAILTAIPTVWADHPETRMGSSRDKIKWMQTHFPEVPVEDIIICRRTEKVQYALEERIAQHPIPILIDDYDKNIQEWENVGKSFAIHHTSARSSLMTLYHYLQG